MARNNPVEEKIKTEDGDLNSFLGDKERVTC
jgi:hypothetical protein